MAQDEIEESQRPSPAKNTMRVFATLVVIRLLQTISGILIAYFLGLSLFGNYRNLLLFGEFLVPLSTMGLMTSSVYYLSNKKYQAKDISFTCFGIGFLHGAATASGLALLWYYDCLGIASNIPTSLLVTSFILMPIQGANALLSQVLVGDSQFSLNSKLLLMRRIVLSLSLIIFVIFFRLGLAGAVAALVLAQSSFFIALLFNVCKLYSPVFTINRRFLKVGYIYGLKSWVGTLGDNANKRVDLIMLMYLTSPENFGIYCLATTVSELAWFPLNALAPVLFNSIAAEKDTTRRIALISKIHRIIIWFMGLVTLLFGGVAYLLIPVVLGEEFRQVAFLLVLLLPAAISRMSSMVITRFFYGIGRPARSSAVHLMGAVVGISLYLILVPWLDIVGAAVATSISYTISAFLAVGMFYYTTLPFEADSRLFRIDKADIKWLYMQLRKGLLRQSKL